MGELVELKTNLEWRYRQHVNLMQKMDREHHQRIEELLEKNRPFTKNELLRIAYHIVAPSIWVLAVIGFYCIGYHGMYGGHGP